MNADFDLGDAMGVNHGVADQLQLDTRAEVEPFMYVAHTSDGLLLKLDTRTGKQVARYATTRLADCPTCPVTPYSWSPSRTAVDLNGNVWVANRSFGCQGSITKIGGSLADCVDRNGNGTIETSRDANGDGVVDVTDPAEFFDQADECLVRSIPVGGADAVLRALALDENGHLWVGGYNVQKVFEVDPVAAAVVREFDLGTTPYGFVRKGKYLYSAALGARVARVDVTVDPVAITYMSAPSNYGITVDRDGIAWFGSSWVGIARCDFDSGATDCDHFTADGNYHTGVTVDADNQLWAASPNGYVDKYASDGTHLGAAACPGHNPYGVAVGHDGAIWSSAYESALRIEPGPVNGAPGACQAFSTAYADGRQPFNYTYSDFTGFQLRNVTVQQGSWTVVHDGSANGTTWGTVRWNQEPGGAVPEGTVILAEVRAADDPAQLEGLPYVEVQNGVSFRELGLLGRYLQVRMTLRNLDTSKQQTPILSDVTVEPGNRAPVAVCRNVTIAADASCGAVVAAVDLDGGSSDPDGDMLSFSASPAGPYAIGATPVELTVVDVNGASSTCTATVTVVGASAVVAGGDTLVSTAGAATAEVTLTATLVAAEGYLPVDQVTFTLSAEGVPTQEITAVTLEGKATVTLSLAPAMYSVAVAAGCAGASSQAFLVVYNPSGGFVTGGGWLVPADDGSNTHPGARASFGFTAKYKAGVPNGSLEFRYSDGHLELKSLTVAQLVITGGSIAQFKGTAMVNGISDYRYFVKAIDNGEPGTNDVFDIKVWAPGVSESADPTDRATGALAGGNIVVHLK